MNKKIIFWILGIISTTLMTLLLLAMIRDATLLNTLLFIITFIISVMAISATKYLDE